MPPVGPITAAFTAKLVQDAAPKPRKKNFWQDLKTGLQVLLFPDRMNQPETGVVYDFEDPKGTQMSIAKAMMEISPRVDSLFGLLGTPRVHVLSDKYPRSRGEDGKAAAADYTPERDSIFQRIPNDFDPNNAYELSVANLGHELLHKWDTKHKPRGLEDEEFANWTQDRAYAFGNAILHPELVNFMGPRAENLYRQGRGMGIVEAFLDVNRRFGTTFDTRK